MWKNPQGVAVTDIGWKKMLFSFKDSKKGLHIIQNGPWNVKRNMVNLRLWREGKSVFEIDHDFMEFWIQVHGIPHDLMDKETCILIGEMLGVLAEVEDPKVDGILRRPYLRIRVSINITKPLPTGFWLDREEMPPLWVFFKYERLPDSYCFNCGILGHEKKTCKNPTVMACWDPTKNKYSPGLGVSQRRPGPTMRGGFSKQQGWREEGEEQAREQLDPDRESGDKQSSEESRIRAEQVLQQKISEKSVWKNQMMRDEEMADIEEHVEEVPKIPDFQEERDTQRDLGAAYKLSNNKKAQKREKRYEVQKSSGNGPIRDIGPNTGALHLQSWNVEGSGLNHYITEEREVNNYKMEDWKLGPEKEKEKETIGQELKRLMLARTRDKQVCKARTEGKEHQELLKSGTEENELKKLSKKAQNREHESLGQHAKPGENIYYVDLASDEDEDKEIEAEADWKMRLAKKLELNLNLKKKRENKQNSGACPVDYVCYGNLILISMVFLCMVTQFFQSEGNYGRSLRSKEEPQAYLGDFNDILIQDEKVGIHPQPRNYLYTFRRFVDNNGLMDVDFKGSKYTWFSNPRNNFITRKILDRVFVNWKWLHIYQNVILKAAPAMSSDHCALILETQLQVRIKKEFRFEAFWTEHEECKEVIRRTELITRTPISLINKKDHFVWPYRNDGQYSVRIGYHVAKEEKDTKEETKLSKASTSQNLREVWETIWRVSVPGKVRMFLWKAVHRILPVNTNLYQRKSAITPRCSICQEEDETIEHALLLCPWTRAVWFGSSLQIVPTAYNVRSFEKWMMNTIEKIKNETGKEHDKFLCNLGCVCWCIWKARNEHIFQQTKVNPEKVIIYSEHLATEYHNATKGLNIDNKPKVGKNGESKRITWRPPPHNKVKVNTDAVFHRETGMAALAAVVRDWQGKIITETTSTFRTTSALAVKAQAYRETFILIKNLQIANCIIETDCLPLVQAIKARTPLAESDAIIRDILQLLDEAPDVGATWTPQEGNKFAHQLAAMVVWNQLQRQWTINPPVQVRNTIKTEAGFVILQHNQHNQNQANKVSVSTSLQGYQREEGLPGRVETETCDRHDAEGEERFRPTTLQRPINDTSNDAINIGRRDSRGDAEGLIAWREVTRQRSSSGHRMTVTPGTSGRTQAHHQELQRGTSLVRCGRGRNQVEKL
ncbi:hypothetical protein Ahy_B05g076767 [Arachis hypogaea]|uniref:CCHC-type domain-containing protein n=1 Tax=Arachis hypogaea TaxID=3818 RepID=A0A444Z408_ARAHY|nr:hypothetical protein Ahy_B05g076767 [Arachis hypogaea]